MYISAMRQPRFLGVYTERPEGGAHSSSGGMASRGPRFFVWEISPADYAIQELDGALEPNSKVRLISAERLQNEFQLEPSILVAPITLPDIAHAERERDTAAPRKAAELNDNTLRELENTRKAKHVENDLRGSFQKALRGLGRPREREAALTALKQIAETTDGIVPAHKHMFRDFGVTLRKKDLPDIALHCGQRVLELAPDDDHGHFNLARILCALGAYDKAAAHVEKAMRLDAEEPIYPRMLAYIRRQSQRPGRPTTAQKNPRVA